MTAELISHIQKENALIIVVDNGSSDDSVEILKNISNIKLLCSEKNLGYSAGNNIGIKYALDHDFEYIWLLNNDAIPENDCLEELIKTDKQEREHALIGTVIKNPDQSIQCFGGGYFNHLTGNSIHCIEIDPDKNLDYLCAASILIHSSLFIKHGLLDERFFLYWEDVEFCQRLKKAGIKFIVSKDSSVIHDMGHSTNKYSSLKTYYFNASSIMFARITNRWFFIIHGIILRLLKSILTLKFNTSLAIFKSVLSAGITKNNANR